MSYFRRLMKQAFPSVKRHNHRIQKGVLEVETLENREMLSTIVWTNRGGAGNDSDLFGAAFGANAPAARLVVDAALDNWERVIPSFNTPAISGVPADTLQVSFTMEELPAGTNGSAVLQQIDAGRPRKGSIKLDFNGSSNNNPGVFGWFVDATPNDNSEFLLTEIASGSVYSATIGRAQTGSPAASKLDLYSIASHEMFHLLGLHNSTSLRLQSTPGLVTDTGIPDGAGTAWAFNGPSTQLLLTSANGFSALSRPAHIASSLTVLPPNAQFPNGLRGESGLGSTATGQGIRVLPSLTDSLFLRDAYNYTTVDPEAFGNFYSVLNTTTKELTVRGQFGNLFPDQIRISHSNGVITTSVDNTADRFPNGTAIDAFVTSYPAGSVSSIKVLGTDADSITIGRGITVPISVTGDFDNFNSLSIEGDGTNEVFTVNNNTISVITAGLLTGGSTITYSGMRTIGVRGFGGHDSFNFVSAPAETRVSLLGGTGSDTFTISPIARNLSGVVDTFVAAIGNEDIDTLVLDDRNETVARTFIITNSSVKRDNFQVADYNGVETVNLNAGAGADIFNVQSTPAGNFMNIAGFGGNDQFNVGLNNDMSGILGILSLQGLAGADHVRLNDQAALTANNYTIFSDVVQRSNGTTISISSADIDVQAPNTNNTFRVISLDSVARYQLIGNGGNDTFEIAPTTQLVSFLVSGDLLIHGGAGSDSLIVHDEARLGGSTYSGFGDSIFVGTTINDANRRVRWDTTESVIFNAGAGNDVLNVEGGGGATLPTIINAGAGNDTFNVTPNVRNFDFISGLFTLNGGADVDNVFVLDTARTTSTNVVFTNSSISRPGTTRPAVALSSIESQRFDGGTGNNTLNASAVTVPVTLLGNSGQDILTGGSNNDTLIGLAGNDTLTGNDGNDLLSAGTGIDTLLGGAGNDTASQVDSGDFVDLGAGEDGILIVGTNKNDVIRVGRQIGPKGAQAVVRVNGQISIHDYINGETVTVFGDQGNDVIILDSSAGQTWKALFHGEAGNDTLIGSTRADILRGGDGDDELIGGDGSDSLYGDNGNDVLRGQDGNDQLFGGDGDDRLLGGDDNDSLDGGFGVDVFKGGAGADSIYAEDDEVDFIYVDDEDLLIEIDVNDKVFGGV